jgi:hypothetical protein
METSNCMTNLRRLGTAMLLYGQEHDGVLPGEGWNKDLRVYENDEVTYACPHQRRIDPRSSGYAMNQEIAGKKTADVHDPASTPLVFDSRPTVPGALAAPSDLPRPARHRNGTVNVVAYADGSVKQQHL